MSEVATAFREAQGKAVATLVRVFGDISLAEDAVQDAYVRALETWPRDGVPGNPAAWIVTAARHRAVDLVRRDARGRELMAQKAVDDSRLDHTSAAGEEMSRMRDDQLRLVFTCCHPALKIEHQVALTLRLIAGMTPAEVARSFMVSEETIAKRLVRAKYKIKAAGIPYRVPGDAELPDRLEAVLSVVYLVYNAGAYDAAARGELRREAIRLAREVVALMPDEPEAAGLLALLLLSESRATARWVDDRIVLLQDQDRSGWDGKLIREGQGLVLTGLRRPNAGRFVLQAAIQGIHCDADRYAETDWTAILRFYDRLVLRMPTPVVTLNRAIAVGEVLGPLAALHELESVDSRLDEYHLLHATRASLLQRLGRRAEAGRAYRRAIALAPTEADRALLQARSASAASRAHDDTD